MESKVGTLEQRGIYDGLKQSEHLRLKFQITLHDDFWHKNLY